ncbi:MAG: hypothetical protein VXV96_17355 [Bdellovibrionota bacterium]|nr:hypothetical protein [Bdellovibrionota bacterium]
MSEMTVVQRISLLLKLILSSLFGLLLIFEYFDGVHDLSDWAVFFFFILMVNDCYIHYRMAKGRSFKEWVLSPRDGGKKLLMNGIFFVVLLISILSEFIFVMDVGTRDIFYKSLFIIWSGIFLGVNIYKLKEAFNLKRLMVTNVALMILIGSVVMF